MLPRFGPILTLLLATPVLACASGSMSLSEDVGLADDSTGGTTRGLPNPDPTFDSEQGDASATEGSDTSAPADSTAAHSDTSETGDPDAGTTTTDGDSGTTAGVEPGTSSSSDTGGSEESGTTGSTGATTPSVDVSGWRVVQLNSAREYEFPQGTILEQGMTIVVGRDASQVEFETWWDVTLGPDVLYFDTGDTFPAINGGETFTLRDAGDTVVDGPTATMALAGNFQRNEAAADSSLAASWDQSPNPNGDATPGFGDITAAAEAVIVLTELSDTTGGGAFSYEFIELRYLAPAR